MMADSPIVDDLQFGDVPDDRPRKVATPKKRASTASRTPPYREGMFIEAVTRFYATMGMGLFPFAPRTAETVMVQAESCAKAWDNAARHSPVVRRMLMPILNLSAGAEVLNAHLPIALAVAMEMRPNSPFATMAEGYLSNMTAGTPSDTAE